MAVRFLGRSQTSAVSRVQASCHVYSRRRGSATSGGQIEMSHDFDCTPPARPERKESEPGLNPLAPYVPKTNYL